MRRVDVVHRHERGHHWAEIQWDAYVKSESELRRSLSPIFVCADTRAEVDRLVGEAIAVHLPAGLVRVETDYGGLPR